MEPTVVIPIDPITVSAPPVRPWRAAPTRPLEDGSGGVERWCRVCKKWLPVSDYRGYSNGCHCAICRRCEKSSRRLRYLRDQSLEQSRARDWGRTKRASAKVMPDEQVANIEPVATVSTQEGAKHETHDTATGAL